MECYCVSSKKLITCEKTKPQTVTVIRLWFHVSSDWSRNNKHSRNFFWCSWFYGKDCNTCNAGSRKTTLLPCLYRILHCTVNHCIHHANWEFASKKCKKCKETASNRLGSLHVLEVTRVTLVNLK